MTAKIMLVLAALFAVHTDAAGVEPGDGAGLDYDRSGTIDRIDRNGSLVRIDGRMYLLPTYIYDRSHPSFASNVGVEYHEGDEVGFVVAAGDDSSIPRLSKIVLLTR